MSDDQSSFKEKIQSIQMPRKPHVEQKDEAGSTQVFHTSGRVDADVHIAAPIHGLTTTNLENAE